MAEKEIEVLETHYLILNLSVPASIMMIKKPDEEEADCWEEIVVFSHRRDGAGYGMSPNEELIWHKIRTNERFRWNKKECFYETDCKSRLEVIYLLNSLGIGTLEVKPD